MSGQLHITEMAVMLTLGAIVSVPMQVPDRGILIAIVVLICTVFFERGFNYLELKNRKLERFAQGTISMLVKDGNLQLDQMQRSKISRQQLYAAIRNNGIFNLGAVKRVYMESSGTFSVYKDDNARPGLSIYPPDDASMGKGKEDTRKLACINCGFVKEADDTGACKRCNHTDWISATI